MVRDGYKMTELGEIPVEWDVKLISEITQYVSYGFTNPMPTTNEGPYMITAADILGGTICYEKARHTSFEKYKDELSQKSKPKSNDILITKDGTLGRVAVVDRDDICINQSVACMRLSGDNIDLLYFVILLQSENIQKRILFDSSGSTIKHIYITKFSQTPLVFPPLPEQQRIAEILSSVDKNIEETEALIEKYQHVKKGLMSDLLTKGIDEEGVVRSEDTHEFKDSALGRLPVEWDVVKLRNVAQFLDNKRVPIKKEERYKMKGNIPYYGASGIIDWVNDYLFDEELILLGEDGENLVSRNMPLAFKIKGKSWVNNHAHVIKPNEDMDIDYLTTYLESLDYTNLITGSAQPKLNQSTCVNILTKTPSPPEQKRIAEILTSADQRIEKEEAYRDKLLQMKKGLMQDLLTGKVRVTV